MWERTYVGLDVHARSVVAGVLDAETGEVFARGCRQPEARRVAGRTAGAGGGGVRGGADRLSVGADAGRGRGSLCGGGAEQAGAAAADRVKTDRRDAERLARLLRIGEVQRCGYRTRGRRGGAGSGARPRGRAGRSDARPPPLVEAAVAAGAGVRRQCLDGRARAVAAPDPFRRRRFGWRSTKRRRRCW